MPNYMVYLFCDECHVPHSLQIMIGLKEEIDPTQNVRDVYDGREMPPNVATLQGNMTICPATGQRIQQRDHSQIFLVKVN